MDKEQAYKIGLAFKLGIIYARGKAHARQLANDDAKWITVHPNGKENNGRPALLDSETGEVLGGMGGKFNGKHISAVPQHGKNEQMGAQMRVNAKNHKADLMNGQNIGFSQTNKSKKNNPIQTPYGNLSTKTQKRLNTVKENTNKYANNDLSNVTDKDLHDQYKELEKSIQAYSSSLYTDNKGDDKAIENLYRKDPNILNAKNEQERILNVLSNRYGMGDIEKDPNKRPFKFLLPNNATFRNERDNQIRLVLNKAENSNKVTKSETNQPAENNSLINQKKDDLKKTYNLDDSQFNEIVNSENFKKYLDNKELVNETVRLNSAFARAYADTDLSKERAEKQKKYNEEQNKKIADYMKKENEKRFKESESVRESVTNTQVTMSDFQINKSSLLQNRVEDLIENDPTTQQLKLKDKKQETQLKDYQDQAEKNRRELLNHANSLRKYYQNNKDLLSDKQKEKIGERLNNLDDSIKATENTLYRSRKVLGAIAEERQKAELKKEVNRKNKENAFYDELTKHNMVSSSPDMYERDADSLRVFSETPNGAKIKTKTNGTFIKDGSSFVTTVNGEKKSYTSKEFRSIIDSDKENKKSDLTTPKERTTRTRTQNKTLSTNKDNGSVASVLNVPDASKWNNKIYNYRNGEKAVFINNQRIVLNAEQYKKLKELAGK